MKKSLKKLRRGFTLIELLVVIAIIGILATIIIVNVASARAKAANAKVASDLSESARIATLCLTEEGTVSAISGSDICTPATAAPGKWPAVSGRATDGGTWAYGTFSGGTSTFSVEAKTGVAAPAIPLKFTCTPGGCVKTGTW